MISRIPIIGTIHRWFENRALSQQLKTVSNALTCFIQTPDGTTTAPLTQKTVALLNACKDNKKLKNESAKLERIYFTFLSKASLPLPATYLLKENQNLMDVFVKEGVEPQFLLTHPEFLSVAKERFWHHLFPFVKPPIQMCNNELFLRVETTENSRDYVWKSWSDIKQLNLDNFRLTYEGFAIGHPDHSRRFVPLKTVDSGGKYALQFITACPRGRKLPSSINFAHSGHSFTQLIIPKENAPAEAEVYTVGFYPRKLADFGYRVFKTVPGVYRNHDSNVSRIQAKQVTPCVKQYIFEPDLPNSPCLFSLVQNMPAICEALLAKKWKLDPITLSQIDQAIRERNEPELDRILITLTEVRALIAKGVITIPIQPMDRKDKMLTMLRRMEAAQGTHPYHMLGSNCTAVSYQQESFAVAFLDAKLDKGASVRVYDSQIETRDRKFGLFDRIRDLFERIVLHFFAALPLTGLLLGTGSTHRDAAHFQANKLVPSILSETAFATHQLLTASTTPHPLFPAGEIISCNTPVLKPPNLISRIRYLWNRRSLLS